MFKANIFWYLIHSFSVTAPLAQWLRLNFISYGIFLSVARVETAYESICDLSRNHLFQWLRLCFAFAIFSEQMTSFASETWTITFVFQIFESSSWVIFLRIRLNASSVYFPFKWPSLILDGVSSSVAFFFSNEVALGNKLYVAHLKDDVWILHVNEFALPFSAILIKNQ